MENYHNIPSKSNLFFYSGAKIFSFFLTPLLSEENV